MSQQRSIVDLLGLQRWNVAAGAIEVSDEGVLVRSVRQVIGLVRRRATCAVSDLCAPYLSPLLHWGKAHYRAMQAVCMNL